MEPTNELTRRELLWWLASGAAGAAAGCKMASSTGITPRWPNVVLIFFDDLGYGDLSCYGSKTIKTPNMDRLAAEGVRFTDFYACAAVCTPSRAGLLTGRYQVRVGLPNVLFPNAKTGLSARELTLAQTLKSRGYATACIGKWHLGDLPQYWPTRHGFDYYFGLPYSNDMKPLRLYRNEQVAFEKFEMGCLTELYTQEACDFIRRSKGQPFFLYLPHNMPHVPIAASDRFKGKSAGGLYGDVVECLDWSVGEVTRTLDALGLANDTLVMISSDNGPWLEKKEHGGSAGPLRAGKGTAYEGGVREPFIARWPGHIPPASICPQPAMTIDLFTTCAELAGAKLPKDRPIDGMNILPLMQGTGECLHDAFYFYIGTSLRAIRSGQWKYHLPTSGKPPAPAKLYDLADDIGETTDLAGQCPEVVKQFEQLAQDWQARMQADQARWNVAAKPAS